MTRELLNHATAPATDTTAAGEQLAAALEALVDRHYDARRNVLDYGALPASREFGALRTAVDALPGIDPEHIDSVRERLALWLNAYNALMVHAIAARRVSGSIRDREDFFSGPHYAIGGHALTLDEIEHGLLRCNRRKYMGFSPLLGARDPRIAWGLPQVEPRLHFALYTACPSSPRLRAFHPETVRDQLRAATREHLEAAVTIDRDAASIELPAPFRWYTADFGDSAAEIVDFVAQHLPDDDRAQWLRGQRSDVEIRYAGYDWSLNDRYAAPALS
jgi:hypothetical protein